MRGFPIVSLGAITTSVDTYVEYTPHNSAIVIPEFEVEEYFSGNKTSAINKYSGGYYQSSYVDSVEIKPNNLNLKVGSQLFMDHMVFCLMIVSNGTITFIVMKQKLKI